MKLVVVLLAFVASTGVAWAQPGSGAGSGSAAPDPVLTPPPAPPAPTPDELRKTCVAAMNADPAFAGSIVKQAKEMSCVDAAVLQAHQEAEHHVQKNQRQVILAYAAMWVIAAGFVLFLWRRQLSLKSEIAQLRRELDAATKDKA